MDNVRIPSSRSRTGLQAAAQQLRRIVLDVGEGELIGSEEALVARLGCSRGTVRQLARLLEGEGLLKVKRGPNGGYFGCRPNARTIEASVSAYLETLDMDAQDVTRLASALWIEVMRKAARAEPTDARALCGAFRRKVGAIRPDAAFADVLRLELEWRSAVFKLTRSGYIELIFEINSSFALRRFPGTTEEISVEEHMEFVRTWRESTLIELAAIHEGDVELAEMGARYSRKIWHRRTWGQHP